MSNNKHAHINLPRGNVRLAITNKCNMNCFYCHNEGQTKGNRDLSYDSFTEIINVAKKFGLRSINFSGGEPMINKDFPKMIRRCIEIGLEQIGVCTNGILIAQNIKTLSSSPNIDVVVGIDTCNPNKISKESITGKRFSFIEENLKLLKKHHIKFALNAVYTKKNKKAIKEICEYCIDKKINLRIIEMDTKKHLTNELLTSDFKNLTEYIIKKFELENGFFYPEKGFFSVAKNGTKIYFYDAFCHNRDCNSCALWTLRIDTDGNAIPCYAKKLRIPIISLSKNKKYKNFLMALYNLGKPPRTKIVRL